MHTGKGRIAELILADERRYARISCAESLIPGPGQYLLANNGSDSLLPVPIFYTDFALQGFIGLVPDAWRPGDGLDLRGPLGHGFSLPVSARRIALVAFDGQPSRLRGLIRPALGQNALVVLVCDSTADDLPDEVEVQPLSALGEVSQWADYIAMDVERDNLKRLQESLQVGNTPSAFANVQILIRTPMPCGGLAECGVCSVTTRSEWKMACKDGPVFDLREI